MTDSNRILKNTSILYVRMFISIFVGLYSTRIVLNALGVNDYGIFNVVAGVVGMLTFFNSAISTTTQRFLSFTLGSNDYLKLSSIFSTSLVIHFILAIFIVIILEVLGIYFIKHELKIPPERIETALIVFHFVVINTFLSVILTPYDGSLVSHENFSVIAFTELFQSISRLIIAIYISYSSFDKLVIYSLLISVTVLMTFIYKVSYCNNRYKECDISIKKFDKTISKEMISFAGWNMFGAISALARGQGIVILINLFFGVVANAAYGIANQVNGQISSFSTVISKAISPQLTKSEGGGDRERMFRLSFLMSKLPFILMALLAIPLIVEMEFVLKIWLKEVPDYSVKLSILMILFAMISALSFGLIAAVQSIGRIRKYQTIAGTLLIMGLPISYFVFKAGADIYSVLIIAIIIELITHFYRLFFLFKSAGFPIAKYLIEVDLKPLLLSILVFLLCSILTGILSTGFLRLFLVITFSSIFNLIGIYFFLLTSGERERIKQLIGNAKSLTFTQKLKSTF